MMHWLRLLAGDLRSSSNRSYLRLAVPTILMNVSVPLIGAVDTAVVGHLGQAYYVGAVGLGAMIFSVVYWGFSFFRTSTVGLAAQAHGRGDKQELASVLGRATLLCVLSGVAIILLRQPIAQAAFWLIDASPQVEQHGRSYFAIRVYAAPAAFFLQVLQGWFYGVQNVAFPVLLTVLVNVLNLVLDLVFVMGLGFDSDGVAWATLVSQYAGMAVGVGYLAWRHRDTLRLLALRELRDWKPLRTMLSLNVDFFIRTLCLLFTSFFFMSRSAALGDAVLAANTILIQLRHITAWGLDGFATGAEVMVGNALGSEDRRSLARSIRLSLVWGLGVALLIALGYGLLHPWFLPLFTNNPALIAITALFVWWAVIDPILAAVPYIYDGILIGASASKVMRNTMLLSVFGIYLPTFLLLERAFGNHGMWAATLVLYLARTVTLTPAIVRLARHPSSTPA